MVTTATSAHELNSTIQQSALDILVAARAGGTASALRSAEHAVITAHLSFATALGHRYRGRGVDDDDLQQLARLGLVYAVRRWNPDLGTAFLPYAYPTILGEIRRYFRDHSTIIRAPRSLRELHTDAVTIAADLEQRLGRPASDQELADATGTTAGRIQQQRTAVSASRALSLDAPAGQGLADHLHHDLASSDLARAEDRLVVGQAMAGLSDRDRRILHLRYFEDKSQSQIAAVIGVSQMQVSRILREVLGKLRHAMTDNPPALNATAFPLAS